MTSQPYLVTSVTSHRVKDSARPPWLYIARHEKLGSYNIYVDENTEVSTHRGVQPPVEKTVVVNGTGQKRVKWVDVDRMSNQIVRDSKSEQQTTDGFIVVVIGVPVDYIHQFTKLEGCSMEKNDMPNYWCSW